MRILFVGTQFPDSSAPTRGTYNAALCLALQKRHQVHAISPRAFTEAAPWSPSRKQFQAPELMRSCGLTVDYPTYWYTPRCFQHQYGRQMWWSVRKSVQKAITEFQPDAVLCYWAHPDGEVGLQAAQLAGIPSAVIVGGTDVLILPRLPKRGPCVQRVLSQSDAVISVSEGLRRATCELGISPERVQTIYQGIDERVFNRSVSREEARLRLGLCPDFVHLVWVGRIVPVKAIPMLLQAVSLLRDRQVRFKLHLLGDGPSRPGLEKMSAQMGLDSYVRFQGPVAHDRLADWYRAADLTVLSSDSEGLPNVLRESLACGTPFVSTDVGSLNEIADPRWSRLSPKGDSQAFADAIESMLIPEAKEAAADYHARTWDDCAHETADLLERLRDRSSSTQISAANPVKRVPLQPAATR